MRSGLIGTDGKLIGGCTALPVTSMVNSSGRPLASTGGRSAAVGTIVITRS